jgi:hypothetical protein
MSSIADKSYQRVSVSILGPLPLREGTRHLFHLPLFFFASTAGSGGISGAGTSGIDGFGSGRRFRFGFDLASCSDGTVVGASPVGAEGVGLGGLGGDGFGFGLAGLDGAERAPPVGA